MTAPTTEAQIDWGERRRLLGRDFLTWQLNVYALTLVIFVAFVAFNFASPFLPLLVREMGVEDPAAIAIWSGLILGAGPIGAILTGPFWGRVADKIGGRATLSRTVFGFALLSGVMAFAGDVPQLAGLRLAMGLMGGFTTVAVAMASLAAPPEWTTRSIGLVQSAQIISLVVGPALGGLMADWVGIRPTFLFSGGLAALAGINLLIVYREPAGYARHRQAARAPGASGPGFRALLKLPYFVPIFFILLAGNFVDRIFQPLVPLFVAGLEPDQATVGSTTGFIVAAGAIAATISANAAGRLVHRFTHAQLLFAALVLGAIGSGLMTVTQNAFQFGILRAEVGLFAGGILTLAYGLGSSLIPVERRASAFGVLSTGSMIGAALAPIVGGFVAAGSLRGAFVLNAAIFAITAGIVWLGLGLRRSGSPTIQPAAETATRPVAPPLRPWPAEAIAADTALAAALDRRARQTADPDLAETLVVLAGRARDRAFRLHRVAPNERAAPATIDHLPEAADDRHFLRSLIAQPTGYPASLPAGAPPDLAALWPALQASLATSHSLIEAELARLDRAAAGTVRRLSPPAAPGAATWTVLAAAAADRPGLARIDLPPGAGLALPGAPGGAGGVGRAGRGIALTPAGDCLPLTPGVALAVGETVAARIVADPDLPIGVLLVGAAALDRVPGLPERADPAAPPAALPVTTPDTVRIGVQPAG